KHKLLLENMLDYVLLFHVLLYHLHTTLPFTLKRQQFPIQPAFAIIINKSQGQILDWIGLYLPTSVFSYGQLYVTCSRITSKRNLKLLIIKQLEDNTNLINYTHNIVYSE